MTDVDRRNEHWRVGKEIPLALLVTLIAQTGGWIWWAATQSAKLDTLTALMAEFKSIQYTQVDARRDIEIANIKHMENRRRIEAIEARLLPPKTRYLKDYQ